MRKGFFNRIACTALTAVLLLSLWPFSAYADGNDMDPTEEVISEEQVEAPAATSKNPKDTVLAEEEIPDPEKTEESEEQQVQNTTAQTEDSETIEKEPEQKEVLAVAEESEKADDLSDASQNQEDSGNSERQKTDLDDNKGKTDEEDNPEDTDKAQGDKTENNENKDDEGDKEDKKDEGEKKDADEKTSVEDRIPEGLVLGIGLEDAELLEYVEILREACGLNDAVIAGILANIERESGFDWTKIGDYGNSYGLCQWDEIRQERLDDFCEEKKWEREDRDTQLFFFAYEIAEHFEDTLKVLQRIENNEDGAAEAARVICQNYEAPLDIELEVYLREKLAREHFYPKLTDPTFLELEKAEEDKAGQDSDDHGIPDNHVYEEPVQNTVTNASDPENGNQEVASQTGKTRTPLPILTTEGKDNTDKPTKSQQETRTLPTLTGSSGVSQAQAVETEEETGIILQESGRTTGRATLPTTNQVAQVGTSEGMTASLPSLNSLAANSREQVAPGNTILEMGANPVELGLKNLLEEDAHALSHETVQTVAFDTAKNDSGLRMQFLNGLFALIFILMVLYFSGVIKNKKISCGKHECRGRRDEQP